MNVTEVILEHHLLSNTFSSFRTIFKFSLIEKREGHNHDRNKQRQLASFNVSLLVCMACTHIWTDVFSHIWVHVCVYVSMHYVSVCCACVCALNSMDGKPQGEVTLHHSSTLFTEVWTLL